MWQATKPIDPLKAPDLDDINAIFYKKLLEHSW